MSFLLTLFTVLISIKLKIKKDKFKMTKTRIVFNVFHVFRMLEYIAQVVY